MKKHKSSKALCFHSHIVDQSHFRIVKHELHKLLIVSFLIKLFEKALDHINNDYA